MCLPAAAVAQEAFSLNVVLGLGPHYPPGAWVPVRIDAQNRTNEAVDGYVEIPLDNDRGGIRITVRIFAPPQSKITAPAYIYHSEMPEAVLRDPSKNAPITFAEWRSQKGATLARCPLLARSINSAGGGQSDVTPGARAGLVFGVEDSTHSESREAYSAFDFGKAGDSLFGIKTIPVFMSTTGVPRLRVAYDSARVVVMTHATLDDMDLTQREALTDYILGGGRVVFFAPRGSANPAGSWFEPYFPVHLIGERYATTIRGKRGNEELSYRFSEPVDVAEAVAGDGQVVWQEEHYVHAAFRKVGLGRVIFVSFPAGALDHNDDALAAMWNELLGFNEPSRAWEETKLAAEAQPILDSLIGRPTVPWSQAATLCGVYVVIVLLVQAFAKPGWRPAAFVVTSIVALGGSLALMAFTLMQRADEQLVEARFATLDIVPEGGGIHREIITFLGKEEPDLTLRATRPEVSLRPIISKSERPTIQLNPFTAIDAGAAAAELKRAWQAQCAIPYKLRFVAEARFDEQGMALDVDNQTGLTLDAPLLMFGGNAFRLPQIPQGKHTLHVSGEDRNVAGDYTNVSVFASASAKLRGTIVKASITPETPTGIFHYREEPPMLIGWAGPETPKLLEIRNAEAGLSRTEAMIRGNVKVVPSPVGSKVFVPGPMVSMNHGGAAALPYDPIAREWLRTPQEGPFIAGFRVPWEAGVVRPTKVTIVANLDASQHRVTLRRGQCPGGTLRMNPAGDVVADWNGVLGENRVEIDLTEGDFDADGVFWLYVEARPLSSVPSAGTTPAQWNFRVLEVSIAGEVVDAPRPPAAVRGFGFGPLQGDDEDEPLE